MQKEGAERRAAGVVSTHHDGQNIIHQQNIARLRCLLPSYRRRGTVTSDDLSGAAWGSSGLGLGVRQLAKRAVAFHRASGRVCLPRRNPGCEERPSGRGRDQARGRGIIVVAIRHDDEHGEDAQGKARVADLASYPAGNRAFAADSRFPAAPQSSGDGRAVLRLPDPGGTGFQKVVLLCEPANRI